MSHLRRLRMWQVQKDREVFMAPDGPVIAERGDVVAFVVVDKFEDAAPLLRLIDTKENDADPR